MLKAEPFNSVFGSVFVLSYTFRTIRFSKCFFSGGHATYAMVKYLLEPPCLYGLLRTHPKSPLSSKYIFMVYRHKKRQTLKEVYLQIHL